MKKLVRTNLTNSPTRRGTENLNIQFYSHDRNNAGFEFVVSNESDLTNYTAKVLFNFTDSASTWEVNGIIEGNVVKVNFNTDLIARCEEVLGYLFLDSDSNSLDVFKFKFNVVLSEIDKNEVEKRRIKHVENIGELELVTKSQLTEELSKLQTNGVDLTNYLTTTVADERYALKNEIPSINGFVTTGDLTEAKKSVVEEVKKLGYAKTTEVPAAYNDSALVQKIGQLEARVDNDTVYDDTPLKERVTALESKAIAGGAYDNGRLERRISNFEINAMINDAEVKRRLTTLEGKTDKFISGVSVNKEGSNVTLTYTYVDGQTKNVSFTDSDTVNLAYDDSGLKARLTNLENRPQVDVSNYALKSELYNDTALSDRVTTLESKQDKDTVYDDSKLVERVKKLEDKPEIDTSHFLTEETLAEKHFISASDVEQIYLKKVDVPTPVNTSKFITDDILTAKNFVTKDELNMLKPNQTLTLNNGTLSITGGNSVELPVSRYEIHGTGMPNGVVEAEIGTTYIDKNKTNGAFKWIKTTNGGNQGWEVLSGDTGWRTLNSISKLTVDGRTSTIKIRRVNNLVTYQFGGLQWGWFGIVRRNGAGHVGHGSSGDRGAKVLGVGGIPYGFRSEASLVGGTYDDRGRPYGVWYLGGLDDSNYIQFTFNDPIPTDRDIGDIRVSAVSYLTAEPWPTQLP